MYIVYTEFKTISNVVTEQEFMEQPHCYKDVVHASTLLNLNGVKTASMCKNQEQREKLMIYLEKNGIFHKVCTLDYIRLLEIIMASPYVKGEYRMSLFTKIDKLFDRYNRAKERSYCRLLYYIMRKHYPDRAIRMETIVDELYEDEPNETAADVRAMKGEDTLRPDMSQSKLVRNYKEVGAVETTAPVSSEPSDNTQSIVEATDKMQIQNTTTAVVTITLTVNGDKQTSAQSVADKIVRVVRNTDFNQ